MAELIKTADPNIWIEEKRPGYVRYINKDGRRWEVHGICDRRGDCLIGAIIPGYSGQGPNGEIKDHDDLERANQILGKERIDSELDVPVTPEFDTCCASDGTLRIVEL